jgi:hypothetical protein
MRRTCEGMPVSHLSGSGVIGAVDHTFS